MALVLSQAMMLGLARLAPEGKGMRDMSPLGRFILVAMLWGVRFAAGAIAAIFAIVVWHPASRLAALRRIGFCLGAKQDALQSFSDGGLFPVHHG
jgi:hypothetical protein